MRATEPGAAVYGLRLTHTTAAGFSVEQQALWGGQLIDSPVVTGEGETVHWRRFDFGRRLRVGQAHEFAIRTWIEIDPEPQSAACFELTLPTREVQIDLAFNGTVRPAAGWSYGPLADDSLIPETPAGGRRIRLRADGSFTHRFLRPEIGPVYGVAWDWG